MAKSSTTKGTKKRVKVKTLAAPKKKLTGKQMKKVKGGYELKNVQVTSYVVAPKKPLSTT